jgi:Polyketide cyclase / dehydrase and lipid transport
MFKKIFLGFAIVFTLAIAIVLLLATRQPDTFELKRSAVVKASPEKIFGILNNFQNWGKWSPWEKLDPAMKKTYSGADSGVGMAYAWEGNKDVGQGRMEITESVPSSKIVMNLEFLKPFKASNVTEFVLSPTVGGPEAGETEVTWIMRGGMPFPSKIMCVFVSMDAMVGKDFEAGLANLKSVVE